MVVTTLDIENSVTKKSAVSKTTGKTHEWIDNSPYCPSNKLVSVGYICSDAAICTYLLFNHTQPHGQDVAANTALLQAALDRTTLLVGHNIKYDLIWLKACGVKYDGPLYDTMLAEYVLAKGTYQPLDLGSCCLRRGIPAESKDMLAEHLDKGGNVDDMPLDDLIKYGKGDIEITEKLYQAQQALLESSPEVQSMMPTIRARTEFIEVLVDMEMAGFKVDQTALSELEVQYRARLFQIQPRLKELAQESLGHTPVNLDSPEQLSEVVFGFKVDDKKEWARYFNLGTEKEGQRKGKLKRRPYRSDAEVKAKINQCGVRLYKTVAQQCGNCHGRGFIQRLKKDGNQFKRTTKCPECSGTGFTYRSTGVKAGLGLRQLPYIWASTGGFSISKKSIEWITTNIPAGALPAKCSEFLSLLREYGAITVYLSSFIEGVQKKVSNDDILHIGFNQCITKTGRLSSSWHNMPRGKTFPIKKVVISRWKDGTILNGDFASLEFRVAALLSGDKAAINDIISGTDIHTQTATFISNKGQKTDRQAAKNFSFLPLFGGSNGTKAEQEYYKFFLKKYSGIGRWQAELAKEALTTKQIVSPSGMHYAFPWCVPTRDGKVTGFTQICNYEIQGFGFEIVMIAIIELHREFVRLGLKSLLTITVHDSLAIDVHPDERGIVPGVVRRIWDRLPEWMAKYYPAANNNVPLGYDLTIGTNWYNQEKL